MLRILFADDHPVVAFGMRGLLEQLDNDVEVLEVRDGLALQALLATDSDFDLLLLDLGLPKADGYECLQYCRAQHPGLPVVIYSAHANMSHAYTSVARMGAMGFIAKSYPPEQILNILRRVLEGETYLPDDLPQSDIAIPVLPGVDEWLDEALRDETGEKLLHPLVARGLSKREAEIFALLGVHKSNRDIALMLGLSEGTVKNQMSRFFKHFELEGRLPASALVNELIPDLARSAWVARLNASLRDLGNPPAP